MKFNIEKTLLLFILLLVFQNTFAQVEIGAKAGINYVDNVSISSNSFFEDDNREDRISYHFGIYSAINLNKKFSFNPELLFSNKGNKTEVTDTKLRLYYLNLPLLLGYNPTKKIKILFGPEIGFLLKAEEKFENFNRNVDNVYDNKLEMGLALGVNYELTQKIRLGLRYSHGLSSAIKDFSYPQANGLLKEEDVKFKNRSIQLSLGFRLK